MAALPMDFGAFHEAHRKLGVASVVIIIGGLERNRSRLILRVNTMKKVTAMRGILVIVALIPSGCSGTRMAERPSRTVDLGTPIVSKGPSIASRWRYARPPDTTELAKSEVSGNLTR
jgi:hypothetical protein